MNDIEAAAKARYEGLHGNPWEELCDFARLAWMDDSDWVLPPNGNEVALAKSREVSTDGN